MKRVTILFAACIALFGVVMLASLRADAQDHLVTDANLNQKLASAKTSADHEMIAEFYDQEAIKNQKEVDLHKASKNIYSKPPMQAHCGALVKSYQDAVDQDKALAAAHREMAKKAGGANAE